MSRRRALGLVAACGLPLLFGADATRSIAGMPIYRWRGRAFGAAAQITLAHPDAAAARALIARCIAEIVRLESVFSLFQDESELSRLNRDGRLRVASLDLRLLLAESRRFGELTGGAFDVTVQPLWQLYARHFAAVGPDGAAPSAGALESARRRVDYRRIDISGAEVGFMQSGMAVTLNGIAQGYITDRIAMILRDAGFDQVLADLGEIAALDPPSGQAGWPVRIADAGPWVRDGDIVWLANQAIATSSGDGTKFDQVGRHHHLFDPRTGESAHAHRSVSVISRSATVSDALSTALSVLPSDRAEDILRRAGAARALFRNESGASVQVSA
jgi:thiamine biosynthesis lipoprotein